MSSYPYADRFGIQRQHGGDPAQSGAIYGGVAGGMTAAADEFIGS